MGNNIGRDRYRQLVRPRLAGVLAASAGAFRAWAPLAQRPCHIEKRRLAVGGLVYVGQRVVREDTCPAVEVAAGSAGPAASGEVFIGAEEYSENRIVLVEGA